MGFLGDFKVIEDNVANSLQAYPQQFLAKLWFGKSRLLWWRGEVTLQMTGDGNVQKVMIHDFLEGPGWGDELKRDFYIQGSEHGDPFHRKRFCHEWDFKGSRDLECFELHILADDCTAYDLNVRIESNSGDQFVFQVNWQLEFRAYERIGVGFINTAAIKRVQFTA